ncbi:MAG TPA: hypothetical protein VFX83_02410, partial [Azonexus sp.]|nr:hypothetical protein [Azonexus sp.]
TRLLAPWIRQHGGVPLMWNTGHALVKAKLKETGAPLAGEMSGHTFFKERWYGFDDGLYTGARLLEILSRSADVNAPLKALPNSPSTPELNIKMAEGEPFTLIDKLKETGAPLAGEMSGHTFFKERWYGFDDGLYTGARLLEILSRSADVNAPLKALPNSPSTPELNIKMAEGEPFALIDKLKAAGKFDGATGIITIDGVRVEFADGFGLARPSNTTPVVVLRFEADNAAALERIQEGFRQALSAVWPGIQLPF